MGLLTTLARPRDVLSTVLLLACCDCSLYVQLHTTEIQREVGAAAYAWLACAQTHTEQRSGPPHRNIQGQLPYER